MTEQTGNNKPNEAEGLAFPLAGNKKLIEEAAATIAVAELVSTHRTWGDLIEPQKDEYRRVARAVLAVFEKALTPTDDDLRDAIDHVEGGINFQDAISSEALRVLISAARRSEGGVSMIARLKVIRGTLTEHPLAERTKNGWQNGATFYPDADVTKVTPLVVYPACNCHRKDT